MAPTVITRPGPVATPLDLDLGASDELTPQSAFAHFDGTGAGGPFLPTLTYYTQDGRVFMRAIGQQVAAGASADVSWFPGLTASPAASSATAPGAELDYVELTHTVNVATGGSGTQTLLIQGNNVTYDGSTRVRVEVFCPSYDFQSNNLLVELWRDATDIARWGQADIDPSPVDAGWPATLVRYDTPPAGAHAYAIKGWTTGSSVALFGAGLGTGGPGVYMQAYLRVSVA